MKLVPGTASIALVLTLTLTLAAGNAVAENRIDRVLPDAPELAAYGELAVGTRAIDLANPGQVDIVALDPAEPEPDPLPTYDRPLRVQVWYPADPSATGSTTLRAYLRDARTEVPLTGRAVEWAAPIVGAGPYPLVIVSHGYPGNRFLMSHLAENIASKGYVVAAIDHTDSTYRTQAAFGSTLRNRTLDQLFAIDEMERLGDDPASFLAGLVDATNTAVVGYSMGGYGAVITAGGGVTEASVASPFAPPHGLLGIHQSGTESHAALADPRIVTAVAFAPWGRNTGLFDAEGLQGVSIPMLFIAGSEDDVSGYETGTRAIFEETINVDRALLTYDNANHNAGAPMPPPEESYEFDALLGYAPYEHYADTAWDSVRMNNIAQHFVTAWLGKYLKGEADADEYLTLVEYSNDGTYDVDDAGSPTAEFDYWKGFPARSAKGLRWETLDAGE